MTTADDELDLTTLDDAELYELMGEDLYDGLREDVIEGVTEALARGHAAYDVLTDGLVAGMEQVGIDFRDGVLFVPEVLLAASAMKGGMELLRPRLAETDAPRAGTLVIGTVKGDIHDIGKNLVGMMMEGAGLEVIDLGINRSADDFVAAVQEHRPELLGMSALLTTTMPYMREVIEALAEAGLRDDLHVLVGGAPVNEEFAEAIGADAYCRDAAVAAQTARQLLGARTAVPAGG